MFSALVIRDLAATIERLHQPGLGERPLILLCGEHHLKVLATDALGARRRRRARATAASKPSCSAPMPLFCWRATRSIAASSPK